MVCWPNWNRNLQKVLFQELTASGVDPASEAAEESAANVAAAVEHELEGSLLLGLQDFRMALSSRVTALKGTQPTNVPDESEDKIKALEEDKETLQHRLDTLEAWSDVDTMLRYLLVQLF